MMPSYSGPGRAESLRLQEWSANERGVDPAQRGERVRPAASRLSPDQALYVSIETQNKMYKYLREGGRINPEIAYRAETLAEPSNIRARQAAGTVHVHPNGRFLYWANRAEVTVEFQGKQVFKGGENSIVVYAINQSTGEPTPIQHIETQKIHPRTFHIDPSGRLLVAEHNRSVSRMGIR
jgi:6-phosphogluconolactonase